MLVLQTDAKSEMEDRRFSLDTAEPSDELKIDLSPHGGVGQKYPSR